MLLLNNHNSPYNAGCILLLDYNIDEQPSSFGSIADFKLTYKDNGTVVNVKYFDIGREGYVKMNIFVFVGDNAAKDTFLDVDIKIMGLIFDDMDQRQEVINKMEFIEYIPNISSYNHFQYTEGQSVNVRQKEFAFTHGDDDRYILQTYGLGPCVCICGYSSELRIGFLSHVDTMTNLSVFFEQLAGTLNRFDKTNFNVWLIGGDNNTQSIIDIVDKVTELDNRSKHNIRIMGKDILKNVDQSVALNTRTGAIKNNALVIKEPDDEVHIMEIQMRNTMIQKYLSEKL